MILPLSFKTKEKKQEKIKEAVQLAMKITDEDIQNFTLSGLLVFADKVIDDNTDKYIRRMIAMTKIGRLFEQEKLEAVEAKAKETTTEIAKKMIILGEDSYEKIALLTGLPLAEVTKLAGQMAS